MNNHVILFQPMTEAKHFDIDTGCRATLGLDVMPLNQYLGTTPSRDDVITGPVGIAKVNCDACGIKDVPPFVQAGFEGPEDAVNKAMYFLEQHCEVRAKKQQGNTNS
jgi:hypothetical protein